MPVGTVGRASAVCRSLSELSGPIQTVQTASDRAERSACRTRCRSCLSAVLRTVQTGLSDLSDLSENCLRLLSDCLAGAQAPSLQTRPLPPPSVPLPGRAKPSRAASRPGVGPGASFLSGLGAGASYNLHSAMESVGYHSTARRTGGGGTQKLTINFP